MPKGPRGRQEAPSLDGPSPAWTHHGRSSQRGLCGGPSARGSLSFQRLSEHRVRHTPLSNPSISSVASSWERSWGVGSQESRRPWFPASSLRTPWHPPALPPSFSSLLPFIPSDAVCGEKHAQDRPACWEQTDSESQLSPSLGTAARVL